MGLKIQCNRRHRWFRLDDIKTGRSRDNDTTTCTNSGLKSPNFNNNQRASAMLENAQGRREVSRIVLEEAEDDEKEDSHFS